MRMSMLPQKSGFHRCTGAGPLPLGNWANKSLALAESVMAGSSVLLITHTQQTAGILRQGASDQILWRCVVERQ
ncbi:hypothetical protein PFLmoz3_05747 [Pseudomonas fluorescens]|uniref:Uncharacterized protein n=1 Tax=Pseudomonas fluorescens TaxID=294 RepID=A0A109LBX8_PSEFL|nr:hypothetical protein PFLmoz3_05747 [Pseudomonas fluorescens]